MLVSVLDSVPLTRGADAATEMQHTMKLVQAAEVAGYSRYWFAEHHGTPFFGSVAPEVLIAAMIAVTRTIRLGAGAVLLRNYPPVKVAEVFRTLLALAPERIDLAVGRATGANDAICAALNTDVFRGECGSSTFEPKVAALLELLSVSAAARYDGIGVAAAPLVTYSPDLWFAGGGGESARIAAQFGGALAYACVAHTDTHHVEEYRERFRPSALRERPRVAISVSAVCADSDVEARRHARGFFDRVRREAAPTLGRAIAAPEQFVGRASDVAEQVLAMMDRFRADELIVATVCDAWAARRYSLEALADALRPDVTSMRE